jgi:hypothetical protein
MGIVLLYYFARNAVLIDTRKFNKRDSFNPAVPLIQTFRLTVRMFFSKRPPCPSFPK